MEYFDGRYEKLDRLGRGAFSEVWKVRDKETGVTEALKIYTSTAGLDEDSASIFKHEFALLANANHPNLLKPLYFGISSPEGYPYLILHYCKNGNVEKMIGKATERDAWELIRDIASALSYLHSRNPIIIHQDIKPANILRDDDKYMLSDFGVSTQVKSSLSRFSVIDNSFKSAGTIAYMAPERFSKRNLPIMSNDIYSLGSTIFELLTGILPFGPDGGLLQKKGADIPELPENYSSLLNQTLAKCLNAEAWKRPKAKELLQTANRVLEQQFSDIPTDQITIDDEQNDSEDTEEDNIQENDNSLNPDDTLQKPVKSEPLYTKTYLWRLFRPHLWQLLIAAILGSLVGILLALLF